MRSPLKFLSFGIPLALAVFTGLLPVQGAELPSRTLSPLAPRPEWDSLDAYQGTITREAFVAALEEVYSPDGGWKQFIRVGENAATIQTRPGQPDYVLRFAPSASAARPVETYWTPARMMPPVHKPHKPLEGVHIALDPGHIGGRWAMMEERWFRIGNSDPVQEGNMTLLTAQHLRDRLQALGAKVTLVRSANRPLSKLSPSRLEDEALEILKETPGEPIYDTYAGANDPNKTRSIKWQSELLFYRTSEIRERAKRVNHKIRPDLVICLHFNAEAWGDPGSPRLVERNHLHLLVHGACSAAELRMEDIRHDMLERLLRRIHHEEFALSESVAKSMAAATGLPPYRYGGSNAIPVGGTGYVWARNLLANRLYQCPVLYLEPHVMNSQEFFERFVLGDYEGTRLVRGVSRKSIYREYADSVALGLKEYFEANRP